MSYALFLFSLLCFSFAFAEEDFSKELITTTKLRESIYLLEGAGGNITAMLGRDGTILVDDDFAEMAAKILASLKELKGESPRFIINTHFHYDHSGGNKSFGSSAVLMGATELRTRLSEPQVLWKRAFPAYPENALPILTFDQEITLHLNGDTIRVIHLGHGHTDGDSIVYFERGKVMSLGDLYFGGMFPIFHPEHKGSLRGLLKNLRYVLRLAPEDCVFVPGHGPVSNKRQLLEYYQMVHSSYTMVKSLKAAGLTLEQIQKNGLADRWLSFSHGYLSSDKWLKLVYENL